MKIGILAGEASGDLLGAKLIQSLRERCPDLQVEGLGGPAMISSGCHSLYNIERLAVMGLVEPLFRLPDLFKLRFDLYRHFMANKPDVFIGIDAPDFNLGLETKLRKAGIPVIHYVSPSVWAWRQKRIHKIAKAVDMVLTLFPFEKSIYEANDIPVRYVGHPLAAQIPLEIDKIAARRALCIDEQATYVALLPGSRKQELKHLSEIYLRAAHLAWQANPSLRFITSHINEYRYQEFYECYQRTVPDLPLQFFTRRSQDVMAAADVAVVTSGTATLETMLYKTPMIIAYRMPSLTYQLAKMLVKTPYIGLPNLLADELLVPELIQDAATPQAIANLVLSHLSEPEKMAALKSRFTEIHRNLLVDSDQVIVDAVMGMVGR